jgi:hypothetical protein
MLISPRFRYLSPEEERKKVRFEIERAYLDFPRGKSDIDASFRNNKSELDKINGMISVIARDRDVSVSSVEMRGYASPESSRDFNLQLSSKRAQSMREYFAAKSTIPTNLFRTGIGGEDWEGLKVLLEDYPVAHKAEILRIIKTEPNLDERERKIRAIDGGAPYKQIFQDLYPKLRRVDCQINYTVRNFTLDEGKERIRAKPKMLSQNEMYQVARTYPEGSKEFNETLITAQEYFPDDDIANLNGAAAALTEGNTGLAEEYLYKVQNTNSPDYANCLGVFYTLNGNFEAAEKFLQKSYSAGVSEAGHNLNELAKVKRGAPKKKVESKAKKSIISKLNPFKPKKAKSVEPEKSSKAPKSSSSKATKSEKDKRSIAPLPAKSQAKKVKEIDEAPVGVHAKAEVEAKEKARRFKEQAKKRAKVQKEKAKAKKHAESEAKKQEKLKKKENKIKKSNKEKWSLYSNVQP